MAGMRSAPAEPQNASHSSDEPSKASAPEKLLFAPAGSKLHAQADQYLKGTLHRTDLVADPLTQFHAWFTAAQTAGVPLPESVCLSTAALPSGSVSSRFVYLKELDARGFVIYSNWATSRKAADLRTNPQASLAFWWREMERQVRVEGVVEFLSHSDSQAYYATRARGSKLGAWASQQSSILPEEDGGRNILDRQMVEVQSRFADLADADIPCPDFWGGVRIVPSLLEFWQGRDSRLHDRFCYRRANESATWSLERLSP